jgi:hypothetical protein
LELVVHLLTEIAVASDLLVGVLIKGCVQVTRLDAPRE